MNSLTRRQALVLCAAPAFGQSRPRVAITMDDVRWQNIPEAQRSETEERLLAAVHGTRAYLFAIGQAVDNEHGSKILNSWSEAGHLIGNHTYEHILLTGRTTPAAFEAGILRNEQILQRYSSFRKWFRFPALKEGGTRETRDRLRQFLRRNGYRNGSVTIDASDWYYNQRLLDRMQADPEFDAKLYRALSQSHLGSGAVL